MTKNANDPNGQVTTAKRAASADDIAKLAAEIDDLEKGLDTDTPAEVIEARDTALNKLNTLDGKYKQFIIDLGKQNDRCGISGFDASGAPIYNYPVWFPIWGRGCNDAAILSYFAVSKTATFANQVRYLYSSATSTNQINADLFTATFRPGFQVVLAATATAGSSQPATSNGNTTSTQTDTSSTAIAKLQQGGDFNLRVPLHLARKVSDRYGFQVMLQPQVGFTVNGLGGQNTITEATEPTGYVPIEAYGEFGSIPGASDTPAVIYGDIKFGGQFVSQKMATKIGTGQAFPQGAAAAGIEFAKSVRVGFQYFFGPSQSFCLPGNGGCSNPTSSEFDGFHLVVTFTPPAGKTQQSE